MPIRPPIHQPVARSAAVTEEDARLRDRQRADQVQRRLLNTQRYRRFRLVVLRECPLCQDCSREAANEVHHIRGLANYPDDLCDGEQVSALCKSCHSIRTGRGE